jgi:hypothetical protein
LATNESQDRRRDLELEVDAKNNSHATTWPTVLQPEQVALPMPSAIQAVTVTDEMTECTATLTATHVLASPGKKTGVEFTNVTPDLLSWLAPDGIRLTLVP